MATHEAAARGDGPTAARFWRVVATDLVSDGLWDVAFVDVLADGARIVRHLASGSAGPGYEPERAFQAEPGWWGGRPEECGEGPGRCHLGVEFDAPVVPTAITLVHAEGPHRARRVVVESSADAVDWTEHDETELHPGGSTDPHGDTVFYAPADVPAAASWRLVAHSTTHGFAWDVRRLRLLRCGREVTGSLTASGDAGEVYDVEHVREDGERFWGGRADGEGRLHLTVSGDDAQIEVDRILVDQGADHWASSVVLERRDVDGGWRTWRQIAGLRPGSNDLLLAAQPRLPAPAPSFTPNARAADPFADRRILVLIAAYRDPELPNTVADALAQAAYPEHVRFAICHQHDDETRDLLAPWADDPRFRVDAMHHSDSRGCCWARNRTFALYDDEPYILQIDAHMRFAARWDVRYVDMLESIDAELPVLSSYPPRYTIGEDGALTYDMASGAQRLYVEEVFPDLTTRQKTAPLTDPSRPERSAVLAAGQLFTRGSFCRDVDYDPEIYFGGEEISLSARAYTHGYDVFAPTHNLVWHLYQHEHPKHWEDHEDHSDRHRAATERLHALFRGDAGALGPHGFGRERTLAGFEDLAGIRLGARRVATNGSVTVDIDRSVIEPRDDYDAFIVVFLDDDRNEVDRREVRAPDVLDLTRARVHFGDVAARATDFVVLPVTQRGRVGELVVRPLTASGPGS